MKNFEFMKKNYLASDTTIQVDSGTGTTQYLYNRNYNLKYVSSGYVGLATTTISLEFSPAIVISRIMLQNHNLKQFKIYYNSSSANTFSPDINISSNSNINHYFAFSSITVSSIQIQLDDTIDSNQEKEIGELIISDNYLTFENNPDIDNYEPLVKRKKIIHKMPDGGVSIFYVSNKFSAKMKLKYIGDSFKSSLLSVFNNAEQFYFVPEATTSSWNGEAYEVLWVNDWTFTYSDDSKTQGYSGEIEIMETTNQ